MTARTLLFTFAISTAPVLAEAQIATLQSGEHADFTRVVVPVPPGADWLVTHQGDTVALSVPSFSGAFDASRLFDLVPRDRLTAVDVSGNTVSFSLGCDCQVAPFVARDRFVVLDFAAKNVALEAPAIEKNPAVPSALDDDTQGEGPLVPKPVILPRRSSSFPIPQEVSTADEPSDPQEALPAPSERLKREIVTLPLVFERTGPSLSPQLQPADLPRRARGPRNETDPTALSDMQQRLALELSTAATRGVLNPVPGRALPEVMTLDTMKPNNQAEEEAPEPNTPPEQLLGNVNNLRVTSSNDLPMLFQSGDREQSLTGQSCPTSQEVDLAAWADDRPFHVQIGIARQQLFAEFDRLDAAGALALTQIYLHYGFGAEALQILSLGGEIAQEKPYLYDIAHILEHGIAPEQNSIDGLLDCETDIALWAMLSNEELDTLNRVDARAALRALSRLPVHLRTFLAPALSQRLLSHGDTSAAAAALRNVERLPQPLQPAGKLAQAELALDRGDLSEGTNTLADVIDDNAIQSPEALIRLVETKLATNQPIDAETAGLIEAYAKELQTADIGPALRRAHVLALVKSNQFDLAFTAMRELGADANDPDSIELRRQVTTEVVAAASDVVFLEHVFAQDLNDINALAPRPKLTLAERLLELGFPERVDAILQSVPQRPLNPARQMLAARAALDLKQPEAALLALDNMTDEASETLRAEAQLMAGAHSEAYELFQRINRPEQAVAAAWLADGATSQSLRDDPLFGPVLALSDLPYDISESPDGMLARTASALEESESARQALENLLSTPRLEIETSEQAQ